MKGDFSRLTFDPRKHYERVLMQQGRVQLDADWNEQQAIHQHRFETETVDVIGRHGAPIYDAGFGIMADDSQLSPEERQQLITGNVLPLRADDFLIGSGRYYVDGLLCENEQTVSFITQPDLPEVTPPQEPGSYLAYLDVWQRHITMLDDPYIREIALGGPDTTTRLKTVWQVKLLFVKPAVIDPRELNDLLARERVVRARLQELERAGTDIAAIRASQAELARLEQEIAILSGPLRCHMQFSGWDALTQPSTGMLNARARPPGSTEDPLCLLPPGAGYQRLENQLYRIEIHQEGPLGTATFKWSRDNGSVMTAIEQIKDQQIIVRHPRPDELGFTTGNWVEVVDDRSELNRQPGHLAKIEVEPVTQAITLSPEAPPSAVDMAHHPKLRRWDSAGAINVEISADNDGWIKLIDAVDGREDGIEVRFSDGNYKTGDYWLIPARTASGDIEWPEDDASDPVPQPPRGIDHHYSRLALLEFNGTKISLVEDCRKIFTPMTYGLQITKVLAQGPYDREILLHNGMDVHTDVLAQGLRMVVSQPIDSATASAAACFVTMELPFPLNESDRETWGGGVIGYQPLILAAEVQTDRWGDLVWFPTDDATAFLRSERLRTIKRKTPVNFRQEWDVYDPEGPSSNWTYGPANIVVQTSGSAGAGRDVNFGLGTVSISKERLKDDARYIGLTAISVPGTLDTGDAGLVFHWINDQDYWLYICHSFWQPIGFSGAIHRVLIGVIHVTDGQVSVIHSQEITSSGTSGGSPREVSLDIKQAEGRLLFAGLIRTQNDATVNIQPFALPEASQAPKNFQGGSGVGLMTRYTAAMRFTRLEIVYPDAAVVLVPAGMADRILTRLTVKRDFLRPKVVSGGRSTPQPSSYALQPQPDFDLWFWLVPSGPIYGYGYAGDFLGIGAGRL
jgi:hypothetical protein